jgi:hypothetical protein
LLLDPNKSCPSVVILPQQSHQAKEAAKNCKNTAKSGSTREIVMEFCGVKKVSPPALKIQGILHKRDLFW